MGRRADGYHQLASLFQAIDLGDTLTFRPAPVDSFTCSDPAIPCDGRNLVIKARELFRKKSGKQVSLAIHLEKKIPVGAGLGGGSSNAATTLWALNDLHGFPYTPQELASWAAEIGSDISFFFSLGTAYCTGRGEILRDLPSLPDLGSFFLSKPTFGFSTREIYRAFDLSDCSSFDPEALLEGFLHGEPVYINDLEFSAFRVLPELVTFKRDLLQRGAQSALMTGSGTAFFSTKERMGIPISFVRRFPAQWYSSLSGH